jgi:hypothetical protein
MEGKGAKFDLVQNPNRGQHGERCTESRCSSVGCLLFCELRKFVLKYEDYYSLFENREQMRVLGLEREEV